MGFIISLFFRNRNENAIAGVAITTMGLQLVGLTAFLVFWIVDGSKLLDIKHFTFYKEGNVEIFIDLFFDKITAVFAFVGTLITFLVAIFSRFYLHRDSGFKRFFNTLLLFFFAYSIVIFSGNFETLFVGWEFLGITSFLLIIFYRDSYLPVKNGLKTISLYRLGDVCLILAMWMSHHLWHENITFLKLNDINLVALHIQEHRYYASFILVMIVIAASIKSAQFPFSSWLPRAMEGPTTSSAIFYGSLSAHIGVFILMRTYPVLGIDFDNKNFNNFNRISYCNYSLINCKSTIVSKNTNCLFLDCTNRNYVHCSCNGLAHFGIDTFCRKCFFKNLSIIGFTFSFRLYDSRSVF